jgi:hypothetical protein
VTSRDSREELQKWFSGVDELLAAEREHAISPSTVPAAEHRAGSLEDEIEHPPTRSRWPDRPAREQPGAVDPHPLRRPPQIRTLRATARLRGRLDRRRGLLQQLPRRFGSPEFQRRRRRSSPSDGRNPVFPTSRTGGQCGPPSTRIRKRSLTSCSGRSRGLRLVRRRDDHLQVVQFT